MGTRYPVVIGGHHRLDAFLELGPGSQAAVEKIASRFEGHGPITLKVSGTIPAELFAARPPQVSRIDADKLRTLTTEAYPLMSHFTKVAQPSRLSIDPELLKNTRQWVKGRGYVYGTESALRYDSPQVSALKAVYMVIRSPIFNTIGWDHRRHIDGPLLRKASRCRTWRDQGAVHATLVKILHQYVFREFLGMWQLPCLVYQMSYMNPKKALSGETVVERIQRLLDDSTTVEAPKESGQ